MKSCNNKETFDLSSYEDDILLKSQLENFFLKILKIPWDDYIRADNTNREKMIQVEFIVTSDCNLKCEYCYLQKFKDDIIPKHCRDRKKIMENLHSFMQYWIREGFDCNLDIFSGEIWQTDFGCSFLETIEDYVRQGAKIHNITIPSNCSFIMYEEYKNRIQNVIDNLADMGVRLIFSASVDGQIIEDIARPPVNKKNVGKKDKIGFYDLLFEFNYKNRYGFHPMLCAYTVEKQKLNLDWWKRMFQKYSPNWKRDLASLMMLEVRNDDWTDDKIEKFREYQSYLADTLLYDCFDGNIEMFTNTILRANEFSENMGYNILFIHKHDGSMNCSMARSMCVRLGDLAVVPCHRMAYKKFVYGYFLKDDNGNITGEFKSNNLQMCPTCNYSNLRKLMYGCDNCDIKLFCIRGCMGSQYENTGDPLACIESVCNLEKAKVAGILSNMERLGSIDYLRRFINDYNTINSGANKLREKGSEIGYTEYQSDKYLKSNSYLEFLRISALNVLSLYDKWKMEGVI